MAGLLDKAGIAGIGEGIKNGLITGMTIANQKQQQNMAMAINGLEKDESGNIVPSAQRQAQTEVDALARKAHVLQLQSTIDESDPTSQASRGFIGAANQAGMSLPEGTSAKMGKTLIPLYAQRERAHAASTEKKEGRDSNLTSDLRTKYLNDPITKNTKDVAQSFEKVKISAQDPSAAGDLSLIFSYMKMLDPGSTVREGEFANAQNAAGVPDQIKNQWNKLKSGERLNPDQRGDFVNQAGNVYKAQLKQQGLLDKSFGNLAQRRGLLSQDVVLSDIFAAPPEESPVDPKRKRYEELKAKAAGGK